MEPNTSSPNPQPTPTPSGSTAGAWIAAIVVIIVAIGVFAWYRSNKSSNSSGSGDYNQNTNQAMTNDNGQAMAPDQNTAMPANSNSPAAMATPTPTPTATGSTAQEKTFTVEGGEFYFKPTQLTVNKGDKVKIVFNNANGFHDFVIDEFNVRTSRIQGGQSATVEFTADKNGSFEYYCSVGQHRAMGMKGTLVVQ